jgi:hypothetical protein
MAKDKLFIGGRIPADMVEEFSARAQEAGISKTELLERILAEKLDPDGDGQITVEDIRRVVRQTIEDVEEERTLRAMATAYIEEDDEDDFEDEYPFDDDEEDEDDYEEPEGYIASLNRPREAPIAAMGGLSVLMPRLLAAELNCYIVDAYREANEVGPEPLFVAFLETLAIRLEEGADEQTGYTCDDREYVDELPVDLVELIDPIIIDAVNEFEVVKATDKAAFYRLLGELATQTADTLYLDSRVLTLSFTRTEYDVIDRLLQQVNEDRPEAEQLADLRAFLLDRIGEEMKVAGAGFLGPRDRQMVETGRELKRQAITSE